MAVVADRPGVSLRPEAEGQERQVGMVGVGAEDQADGGGGLADGLAQQVGVETGGRRPVVVAACGVQADHGVVMDGAPAWYSATLT